MIWRRETVTKIEGFLDKFSDVSRFLGNILMRGRFNPDERALSIISEHKQPLSIKACTINESFIKALTKNGL